MEGIINNPDNAYSESPHTDLHPEISVLQQYAVGALSEAEEESVMAHFEACTTCADLVLALKGEQNQDQNDEIQDAWAKLLPQLGESAPTDPIVDIAEVQLPTPKKVSSTNYWGYGLAAIMAMALITVLWQGNPTPPSPGISNPRDLSLNPVDQVNRAAASGKATQAAANLVLSLTAPPSDHERFQAEVIRDGHSLEKLSVVQNESGLFLLSLPAVQPGSYEIHLSGHRDGQWVPFKTYKFNVDEALK